MKRKNYVLMLILLVLLYPMKAFAMEFIDCGNITRFPAKIPQVTSLIVTIVQITVPVILVIVGSMDLIKGLSAAKEEDIKKGQQLLIKRLILAIFIFFVIVVVKFVISLVADNTSSNNISSCIDCFISNRCRASNAQAPSQQSDTNQSSSSQNSNSSSTNQSSSSQNPTPSEDPSESEPDRSKMNVFVGDERTQDMCGNNNLCESHKYISKDGANYSWFENQGIFGINQTLGNVPQPLRSNVNIIIMLGLNDALSGNSIEAAATKYTDKIKELSNGTWKDYNIIFVSVNPTKSSSNLDEINTFNTYIKTSLQIARNPNIKYCDTNTSLTWGRVDYGDNNLLSRSTYARIYEKIKSDCL